MLASGAHVSIDGTEFMIHEDQDLPFPSYSHNLEPLFVGRQDVSGKPGRQNIRPELALWALDDWSGGEGAKVFDPDIPNTYDVGHGNPRIAGLLKGRPARDDDTHTLTGNTQTTFQGSSLADVVGAGEDTDWYTDIGRTFNSVQGNAFTNEAGTPGDLGDNKRLSATYGPYSGDEQASWTGRTPGARQVIVRWRIANAQVANSDRLNRGYSAFLTWRFFIWNVTDSVYVLNETIQYSAFGNGTFNSGAFDIFRTYAATAGKTYKYGVILDNLTADVTATGYVEIDLAQEYYGEIEQVQQGGRTPGAVAVIVNFTIQAINGGGFIGASDGLVNWEVDVIDDLNNLPVATGGTTNPTVGTNLSGSAFPTIKFTGVAGRTYRYRVKKTVANDLDLIRAHNIGETVGPGYPGDIAIASTRNAVWVAFGDQIARSENGVTWELKGLSVAPGGTYKAIAAAADQDYLYIVYHDNPVAGSTGNLKIMRVVESGGATWTSELMFGPAAGNGYPQTIAVAPALRGLYLWGPTALTEFDLSTAAPWTATVVHTLGTAQTVSRLSGIVAVDDNSVAYFHATPGHTVVYQFKNQTGRALWYLPPGVTGRALAYNQGILILAAGDNVTTSPGIDLYALNMRSEQSVHLGNFRTAEGGTMYPVSMGIGPGTSFLVGSNEGHLFSFDAEKQGFSVVDHLEDEIVRASTTFLNRRIAATGRGGGAILTHTWEPDTTAGQNIFSVESSLWDFDFPEAQKTLQGFMVNCKEIPPGSELRVYYRIDGTTGDYILAGTVTAAGRVFVSAPTGANTVTFNVLQIKVEGEQLTATHTPVLLSCTAYTSVRDKQETWDLVLRAYHEDEGNPRPSSLQRRAENIRDKLVDASNVGRQVTFLDGYRREGNEFSSHTVLIDEVSDVIRKSSEGYIRTRLRRGDA